MNHEMFVRKPQQELDGLKKEIQNLLERVKSLRKRADHLGFTIEYNRKQIQVGSNSGDREGVGPYSGLTLVDAVITVLDTVHHPMDCRDLTKCLLKGGFRTESERPNRYVYSALTRESKQKNPRVTKQGAFFGIASWDETVWERKKRLEIGSGVRRRRLSEIGMIGQD